jgi:DNA-binding NtrC family response regulator
MRKQMTKNPALLIADPRREFIRTFRQYIQDLPIRFIGVATGKEAITKTMQETPFIFILNTRLQDMDGLAAIDRIRMVSGNDMAIVAIMENDSMDMQAQLVQRNVLCKIIEPLELSDLRNIIEKRMAKVQAV